MKAFTYSHLWRAHHTSRRHGFTIAERCLGGDIYLYRSNKLANTVLPLRRSSKWPTGNFGRPNNFFC
eukprot:scaffold203010_cov46-Cyclotella_meneghiniana.AAC.1